MKKIFLIIFLLALILVITGISKTFYSNDINDVHTVSGDTDTTPNNIESGNNVNIPSNEELLENLFKDNINLNTSGSETKQFIGTVIEERSKYIIVKPNDDEKEIKVADKIIVTFKEEHEENIYGIGTKVLITYDGLIAESYPAQINEISISIVEQN